MVDHSKKTYMLVACDCGPVGSGRQIELAVAGMVAAGHRVCVVLLSSGGGLATRLQAVGAKVCVVNISSDVRVSVTFHVAKIIRNEQPQGVIGWGVETAIIVGSARFLARLSGHSWRYIQLVSQPSLTVVETAMVARADQIIVMGESVLHACERMELLQSIHFVPPAAVAFDEMIDREQLASQIGLNPGKKWTLCVALCIVTSREMLAAGDCAALVSTNSEINWDSNSRALIWARTISICNIVIDPVDIPSDSDDE